MATAKLKVKVPPIVSINPRGTANYGQPAAFEEQANSRIFGVFAQVNSQGQLVGALELGGNIAPFHTCCGGMRVSALRADYRPLDTWYPANPYIGTNSATPEQRWTFMRDNLSSFPTISQAAEVDASGWSREKIVAWGRAVICAHIKSEMHSWRRSTLIALDRVNGHTAYVLGLMKHIDNVYYSGVIKGTPFGPDGRLKADSNPHFRPGVSTWQNYLDDHWAGEFRKLRAYGTPMTRNLNSGNMLMTITVCPEMTASHKKTSGAKLLRSSPTGGLAFEQYVAPSRISSRTVAKPVLDFYKGPFFHKVCPSIMTHA